MAKELFPFPLTFINHCLISLKTYACFNKSLSGFWSRIAITRAHAEYGSTAFYERAAELL